MEAAVLSKPHRLKYDFFLSFRGEDTRDGFAERLYDSLHRKEKVLVFRDNEGMKRGEEINPSLIAGMEDSAASLVLFSPRYSDSHWCLDELAKLCDLSSSLDRPMIPIFYMVDPSHVRKQSSKDFVNHFEVHDKRFSKEEIQPWREAMKRVGNLPGYIYRKEWNKDEMIGSQSKKKEEEDEMIGFRSKNKEKEDEMIGLVVKRVLAGKNNTPEKVGEYTVGLESRVDDLMNLVNVKSSSHVQILGLYGIGGIGKTTLAKRFYKKMVEYFKEKRVFISNVRRKSSGQDGLVNLQKTFIKLLRSPPEIDDVNQGRDKIRESVHEKKILVVLDDVDNVDQVDALIGERSWYGEGSLIVITTRDEEILNRLSVSQKYEVKCLNKEQALKLFSYHSLRKEKPTGSLLKLSDKIVEITGLLPLAVEVSGSLFYDKKEEKEWLVQLKKLENSKPNGLQDVLKISFESLDDEEKKVFLDIACLFLKMEMTREEIVDVLNGCGFNAEAALSVLRQKSLVKFLADNTLWMHDQIQDMGMQIVLQESLEDPGKRSRLSDRGEVMNVLNTMKGTTSIRGIVLDFKKNFVRQSNLYDNPGIRSVVSYAKNIFLKPTSTESTIPVRHFVPMKKLRLLQINHVELQGNLDLLPSDLKWIQWRGCPLKDVPPSFLARQLAVLDLSESGIRRIQSFDSKGVDGNLKVVNLRGCHSLEAIPDLSNHKSLQKLVFERCMRLVEVPRSVGTLRALLHLDFRKCPKLTEFLEDVSGLKSLEKLYLSGCSNLSVLPENIGAMPCLKELLLDETGINELPESIFRLENLQKLSLKSCKFIQELPKCIGTLTSLEELDLSETALKSLPESIGSLISLQKLHVMDCKSLTQIPDTINKLTSLQELIIDKSAVEELPLSPDSLPCLTKFSAGGCKSLKQVPSSIGRLSSLLQLKLDSTPIETLPEEITHLHFIQKLELRNCLSLKSLPDKIEDMDTLHSLYLGNNKFHSLPSSLKGLSNLKELLLHDCQELKCVPPLPFNLEKLNLANCFSLESISDLSELTMLKELNLRNCKNVDDVPGLEHLTALKWLDMSGCNSRFFIAVKKRLPKVSLKMLQIFEEGEASSEGDSTVT
ncbi:unnamed protein product [Eruca vesicaria subsp. sativa]|uniref:TIR domain-containing protein n=1 Tax=Eruca vesicaria subsp. sativa TaxID=29727 RepID=A0ABC8KRJ1_ERUVS|nr:unnamed protein product [Eruca vesicaria subsp. sativa]